MPVKIGIKKRLDSEKIVEEFMIAINGEVARILT
jgi:exoribonuclease R